MPSISRVADLTLAHRHVVEIARASPPSQRSCSSTSRPSRSSRPISGKLFDLIKSLRQQGVAIVYVSHRLHEVDGARRPYYGDARWRDDRYRAGRATSLSAEIITLIAGRPLGPDVSVQGRVGPGRRCSRSATFRGGGFDEVELTVRAGEIVGLAGVEGEGQREFLRAVAGVDVAPRARSRVAASQVRGGNGRACARARRHRLRHRRPPRRRSVPQRCRCARTSGSASSTEIARGGVIDTRARRSTTGSRRRRAACACATASLEAPVSDLSGGNQQKVSDRARNRRRARGAAGRRADQGRRCRRPHRNLSASARAGRAGARGGGVVVGRHRARRPVRPRVHIRARHRSCAN